MPRETREEGILIDILGITAEEFRPLTRIYRLILGFASGTLRHQSPIGSLVLHDQPIVLC